MAYELKVIPTLYAGTRFRSRAEARWVPDPNSKDPDAQGTGDCHYEPCVCACGATFGFAFEHRRERIACTRCLTSRYVQGNPVTHAADHALQFRFY